MADRDVIVIGAGLGGLAAAALLAKRGLRVTVVEQHFLAGGYCTSWRRSVRGPKGRLSFGFDCGVHDISGLGPRGRTRRLLAEVEIEDRLTWERVGHEYVLPGLRLKVPETGEAMAAELAERFPEEREGLDRLLGILRALSGSSADERDPQVTRRERHEASRWLHRPYAELVRTCIRDALLQRALLVLTGYLSHEPDEVSSAMIGAVLGYWFEGGFFPRGGAQELADAFVSALTREGGTLRLSCLAKRIRVEQGRVAGVELASGEMLSAPVVISNADVKRTFAELVGAEHVPVAFRERVTSLPLSSSAFLVYLGLDTVPDVGPMAMVYPEGSRGFAFTVLSRLAPSLAPEGHASVILTRLVPPEVASTWDRSAPDYVARRTAEGDLLVQQAEALVPDLERHIVYRAEASPATFARYTSATGGAIYGVGARGTRLTSRTPLAGLYLAGAGVFPGPGVEAVLESGRLAADEVAATPLQRSC